MDPSTDASTPLGSFRALAGRLDPKEERFAVELVEALLAEARAAAASDIHVQPTGIDGAFEVTWRLNGVLQPVATVAAGKQHVVARLKVLAELLTYKTDVPQEGRIRRPDDGIEMRLSTFPTVHGEKAVVRLFIASGQYQQLDQLGFPEDIDTKLRSMLESTSGVIVVAGPSGSGKTTTLYAALRAIQSAEAHRRSIASLEDPVEALIPGVAQSQIRPVAGFTYATGLKSLVRQDPDVIMVGEIRDRETAETVFQASLTGHLVLTSFHAGTSAEAISRLSDIGVEPYVLRSGLRAILTQRLARRLCSCSRPADEQGREAREAVGCPACRQTGYSGRLLLAELVVPADSGLREEILLRRDASVIQKKLDAAGVQSLRDRARDAVRRGLTTPEEVRRVLGAD